VTHVKETDRFKAKDKVWSTPPASAAIPVTVEQATYPSLFFEYMNLRITMIF
jgi:hypothetical protein